MYYSSDLCSTLYCLSLSLSIPQRYGEWQQKFGQHMSKKVSLLTGETSVDLRLLRDVSSHHHNELAGAVKRVVYVSPFALPIIV